MHNELGFTKLDKSEAEPTGFSLKLGNIEKKHTWLMEQRSGLVFLVGFMMNKFIEKYTNG
jgi:hypothetical protein